MANPFFSGRIPAGLAEKIDNHLLITGETRSELLIRLLRVEVNETNDNKTDNNINNILSDLILRVSKLEKLANSQNNSNDDDDKLELLQVKENKSDKLTLPKNEITLTKAQVLYLKQIKDMVAKTDKTKTKKLLDLELIVQLGDDLILTSMGEVVLDKYKNS